MQRSRNARDKKKLENPAIRRQLELMGRSIQIARKTRNFTQEELAAAMLHKGYGIHQSNISRFEKGREDPCYTTLVGLAEVLDIPIGKLVEYGEYITKLGREYRKGKIEKHAA